MSEYPAKLVDKVARAMHPTAFDERRGLQVTQRERQTTARNKAIAALSASGYAQMKAVCDAAASWREARANEPIAWSTLGKAEADLARSVAALKAAEGE